MLPNRSLLIHLAFEGCLMEPVGSTEPAGSAVFMLMLQAQ